MKECEDCVNTDIAGWEVDKKTGNAKIILWCERYKRMCEDIQDCAYFDDGKEQSE